MTDENSPADDAALRQAMHRVRTEVDKAVVGQAGTVTGLLVSLLARGHVLLEGVPGVAKTLVVRSFARALGLDTKRVQFTPDLMPGDVTGSIVYDARTGEFDFRAGPVFTHILLADEINRTPPKTQAALLEAMEERQVSADGVSRALPDPFLVAATQNPIEHEGTYSLPEAQLDRFMFSLQLDYPGKDDEMEIVRRTTLKELPTLTPSVSVDDILAAQRLVLAVPVSEHVLDYAVELASATRPARQGAAQVSRDYVEWGAGPRASQYLILGAKALALLDGRVTPETADVRAVAHAVLQHRVITNYRATGAGKKSKDVLDALLKTVKEREY